MARPSSLPASLTSVQRITRYCPGAQARPATVPEIDRWLAARLPSRAPDVPLATGRTKSRPATGVNAPDELIAVPEPIE